MEEKKMPTDRRVGIGTILPPGSYQIEEEVMLLRVRLKGTPISCLIDGQRRVREIAAGPAVANEPRLAAAGEVAFDASKARENGLCPGRSSLAERSRGYADFRSYQVYA